MVVHALEHIHHNFTRAKSYVKRALKFCGERGDWGRFVVYRDMLDNRPGRGGKPHQ